MAFQSGRASAPSSFPAHLEHQSSTHSNTSHTSLVPDPTLPTFGNDSIDDQFLNASLAAGMDGNGASRFTVEQDNMFNQFVETQANQQFSNSSQGDFMQEGLKNQMSGHSGLTNHDFGSNASLDPSLLMGDQGQPGMSNDGALSLESIVAMQQPQQQQSRPSSTLLHSNSNLSSHSPSPHHSPSPSHTGMGQLGRPRGTSQSLGPLDAMYPPPYHNGGWDAGAAFQVHRRQPSDTRSDISSHSANASPYMEQHDTFDPLGQSPLMVPQNDGNLFADNIPWNQFTIADNSLDALDHFSPATSMTSSPNIASGQQQQLPLFTAADNFGLPTADPNMQNNPNDFSYQNPNPFGNIAFPNLDTNIGLEGQADAMSPPEINISLAPPSRVPTFPRSRAGSSNELAPPEASLNRRRHRARSDPYHGSRPTSPMPARGRSPSLQPPGSNNGSLAPSNIQLPSSRSPSPSTGRNRSVSAASSNRSFVLDLADPERPTAGAGGEQRKQKHPATFQCTLCPKRFTRAYNLRSHLRTHTNERPFVCTVCNKAFARQHDRKRHEGLHSGEKKFVCRGNLNTGQPWGCGRKFARADALGRHFRSEAGRECIKPLLEEEREERQKAWMAEQESQMQMQNNPGFMAQPPPVFDPSALMTQLPAALLQLYPDLANFDLSGSLGPSGAGTGGDEDFAGHSSFDGSELDMSDNDMSEFDESNLGQVGPSNWYKGNNAS